MGLSALGGGDEVRGPPLVVGAPAAPVVQLLEVPLDAISWDMMDERPTSYPGFAMSTHLAIPFLGLVLVDNTNPERLAKACAEEGRYEFLFTATPIRLVGSTGAPAHPLAVF